MIDLQDVKVKNTEDWDSICPFPVGFVYMSTSKTSPATTYGGQWTNLAGSRFPMFVATTGASLSKGGSKTHCHLTLLGKTEGEPQTYFNDDSRIYGGEWTTSTGAIMNSVFTDSKVLFSGTSGNMLNMNTVGASLVQNTPSRFSTTGQTNSTPPLRQPICVVQNRIKTLGRW